MGWVALGTAPFVVNCGRAAMIVLVAHLGNLLKHRYFYFYCSLFFTSALESGCCHSPESSLKSLFHGILHTGGIQSSAEAGGGVWSCQGARQQTRNC